MQECGKEWCEQGVYECKDCEQRINRDQLPLFPEPTAQTRDVAELLDIRMRCEYDHPFKFELMVAVTDDLSDSTSEERFEHLGLEPEELSVAFIPDSVFSPGYHMARKQIIVNNLAQLLVFQDLLEKLEPLKTLSRYDVEEHGKWLNLFGKYCHEAMNPDKKYDWICI